MKWGLAVTGLCVTSGLLAVTVWSGEGRAVALRAAHGGQHTNIYVVTPGRVRVTRVTNNSEAEEELAYNPSWSPDSGRLTFAEFACEACKPKIEVVPAQSFREHRPARELAIGVQPRFSPDGKRIVFVGLNGGITVMNVDGSRKRLLVKGGLAQDGPSWSPDGKKIVFSRQVSHTLWRLYVIGVNGKKLHPLATGVRVALNPAWSPDGRKIAYAGQVGSWHIYTVGVDGSKRRRISDRRTSDTYPAWSPNGRRLAFVRQEGSTFAVFTMTAGGKNVRRLSPSWMTAFHPAWSSSGKIAFAADHR